MFQGLGDLPQLMRVDIPLLENLADGARVARQALRQPNIAAPLPLQFGPDVFPYVWQFVHAVCLLPRLALKKPLNKRRKAVSFNCLSWERKALVNL